jgi:hypothetical protein
MYGEAVLRGEALVVDAGPEPEPGSGSVSASSSDADADADADALRPPRVVLRLLAAFAPALAAAAAELEADDAADAGCANLAAWNMQSVPSGAGVRAMAASVMVRTSPMSSGTASSHR